MSILDRLRSTPIEATYADAIAEAILTCKALDLDLNGAMDAGDLIRFAYNQGKSAEQARLAAPGTADAIDLAITDPGRVLPRDPAHETDHHWTVRAIQQAIAYGVPK